MDDAGVVLAHYFGAWDTPAPDLAASPIGARAVDFVQGRSDEGMDPRVARAIRTQFHVVHAYRVTLESALQRAMAALSAEAQRGTERLHLPMEPRDAYQMGGAIERQRAMSEAKQIVQDAINEAWAAAGGVRG